MNLFNPQNVTEFLKWGSYAIGFGMLISISFELIMYGVVKAFDFFRL